MKDKPILTTKGKIPCITVSFRVPITIYPGLVDYCRENGMNPSSATLQLWLRELAQQEAPEELTAEAV